MKGDKPFASLAMEKWAIVYYLMGHADTLEEARVAVAEAYADLKRKQMGKG